MKTKLLSLLVFCMSFMLFSSTEAQVFCNASFTIVPDSSGYGFQFQNTSTGNYTSSYWNFGDGGSSTQTNPYYTYNSTGYYMVCLTISDSSCQSTFCDSIYAGPQGTGCQAYFSFSNNPGTSLFTFTNLSSGTNTTSYWDFGDGTTSTLQNPTHTYSQPGTYAVCLTIGNFLGCSDTYCSTITIANTGGCDASFGSIDSSGLVYFYPNVYSATANYTWSFGDGSSGTGAYPVHAYNVNGYVVVCCTVTDSVLNCTDTWCDSVYTGNGGANCAAYYSYSAQGLNAYFYGSANTSNVIAWDWDFGNGVTSTLQNPTITFGSAGTYWVCLTITTSNGCINTTCNGVAVTNSTGNCNAQFQVYDSAGVSYFFPVSTGAFWTYFWDFGDNTVGTGPYPTHQYSGNGPWIACLTVTDSMNNCSATWCDTVYSNPGGGSCQAYFSASLDTMNGAQFYNLSGGNYTTLYWSFGDGTASSNQNPYHLYANPGTYIVCLTVYGNNCQDSYCDSVVIGSGVNCVPQFYTYPDSTLGSGNMNFGLFNNCPGWTYSWTFGDNTGPVSGTAPAHQYGSTGWYTVCVEATDSNGNVIVWCDSIYAFRVLFAGIQTNNSSLLPAIAYPNPSSGPVTIQYTIQKATEVAIEVLSIDGKLRYSSIQQQGSGIQEQQFNTSDFPSGIYLVRIHAGGQEANLKIIVQ